MKDGFGRPASIQPLPPIRRHHWETFDLAKPNYQFEKRQRDLEKKKKQEEKRLKKLEKKTGDGDAPSASDDGNPPSAADPAASS